VKIRTVAACVWAAAFGLVLSAPASAQTASTAPQSSSTAKSSASGDDYKGDVDAGVDVFNHVRDRGVVVNYKTGWHAGVSYRVLHVVSLIAEGSGDYKKQPTYTANIYTFGGGIRFESMKKDGRVKPFAQFLMGASSDNNNRTGPLNHYLSVTPGGGVDLGVAKHIGVRLKLDFPLYSTFGDAHKGTRLAIGLTLPYGTR
jgi:hypothetical protein